MDNFFYKNCSDIEKRLKYLEADNKLGKDINIETGLICKINVILWGAFTNYKYFTLVVERIRYGTKTLYILKTVVDTHKGRILHTIKAVVKNRKIERIKLTESRCLL